MLTDTPMPLWTFWLMGCAVVCCLLGLVWDERSARTFFGTLAVGCMTASAVASNWMY